MKINNINKCILLFSLGTGSQAFGQESLIARGDGSVGNGGDLVECVNDQISPFEGLYSLDYVVSYNPKNANADIVNVKSWEESAARLARLIENKIPSWSKGFNEFVETLFKVPGPGLKRAWSPAQAGLIDLKDERLVKKLPKNCQNLSENGNPTLMQAVIRRALKNSLVYDYDYSLLNKLQMERPLQMSFTLVHEFLWDHTDNIQLIRDVNRYLHSENFDNDTSDKIVQWLNSMGISTITPRGEQQIQDSRLFLAAIDEKIDQLVLLINQGARIHQYSFNLNGWDWSQRKVSKSLNLTNDTEFGLLGYLALLGKNKSILEFLSRRKEWSVSVHPNDIRVALISKNYEAARLILESKEVLQDFDVFGGLDDSSWSTYFETAKVEDLAALKGLGISLQDSRVLGWIAEKNKNAGVVGFLKTIGVSFAQTDQKAITYKITIDDFGFPGWSGRERYKWTVVAPTALVTAALRGNLSFLREYAGLEKINPDQKYKVEQEYNYGHVYYRDKTEITFKERTLESILEDTDSALLSDELKDEIYKILNL
jgi:hypothetical protein